MNIFDVSKKTLIKIVENDLPFALALRNTVRKVDNDPATKNSVTALLGCELRHHFVFTNLINEYFGDVPFEKTVYLRFYLANHLFLKRFGDSELEKLAYQDLDKEALDALIERLNESSDIIPENLDKSSPEFLSLRFNTPAWVIRMWQKQYGRGIVFKQLKSNYKHSIPMVRFNGTHEEIDDFISTHPEFSTTNVDKILKFEGKGTPKNLPEFKSNKIFFFKMATKYVIDRAEPEAFKKIVVYSALPNNIYLDLAARFGSGLNLDLVISHVQSYFDTKKQIEANGIVGADIFNSEASSLITCVSSPADYVFCLPACSLLDLLRSTPDYAIRLKQDKLDSWIAGEKAALDECTKILSNEGKIIYMIPTLSKKESVNVIGDFLVNHPGFELVEEKQFFPFDEYDSCLYYAILKKKEN